MIITQTPLRVSLVGGPTDVPQYAERFGGEVIGFGIDKFLFAWVKERFDRKIIVNWTRKESVDHISEIQHELVREAASKAGLTNGFEVITTADIPSEGSGLGSSSALTVGLLNAFYQYSGVQSSTELLAKTACEIEIGLLKKPIGKQDQYLAAYGGIQHLCFEKDGCVKVSPINLSTDSFRRLNQNLFLFYTGTTRKASDILSSQLQSMDGSIEMYHQMKKLVPRTKAALESGKIDEIGPILHEAWTLKKSFSKAISSGEIDLMYDKARKAGATGGKLCGAGGGGFLLVYCPLENQETLRSAMSAYAEMPFQIERDGTKSIFNVRRPMWKTIA